MTQCAKQAGISAHFARKLVEEARVELDDQPPSGDDLRVLARRL